MGYKTIVCGVTGSAHSQKAALRAAVLAKENNAALVYVYAVDASFLQGGVASSSGVKASLMKLGAHIVDIAEQLAATQGVTPKKIVRAGKVLDVLKEVVMEEKADLLLLGHEERTFFEKVMFRGGVEDHVQELQQQTGITVDVVQ